MKLALNRLEELDLIQRRSQGTRKPNRIYVKFPSDLEAEEVPADSGTGCAADTMPDCAVDRGTGCVRDRKLAPNKKYRERRKDTEEGSENTAPARGRDDTLRDCCASRPRKKPRVRTGDMRMAGIGKRGAGVWLTPEKTGRKCQKS